MSYTEFHQIFHQTIIELDNKSVSTSDRIINFRLSLVRTFLFEVGRFMYNEDVPVYALMLIKILHPVQFEQNSVEWNFFLNQLELKNDEVSPSFHCPSWVPSDRITSYGLLAKTFPNLIQSGSLDDQEWMRWVQIEVCEKNFPTNSNLSTFQQILFVQSLRPDRLLPAITDFCCFELGVDSILMPLDLSQFYKSKTHSPIYLLIHSPGADPTNEIEQVAAVEITTKR